MIVELLGMPGSGKTTLNRLLKENLTSNGCVTITFEDALETYLRKYINISSVLTNVPARYHISILRTLYKIWFGRKLQNEFFQYSGAEIERKVSRLLKEVRMNCPDEYKKRKRWFEFKIRQYVLYKKTTKTVKTVALSDEGISSSIGNLFVFGSKLIDQEQVESLLRNWLLPDILITVKAKKELCLDRLKKRGFPELLVHKSIATIGSGLENQSLLDEEIINEAQRRGIPVYYIKNEHNSIDQLLCTNDWKHIVKEVTSEIYTEKHHAQKNTLHKII